MAGEKTQVEIDAQIDAGIKVNGNKEITPPIHNAIEKALSNSYVNKKDGGKVMQVNFGQSTYIAPTDDEHYTPKKYVSDLFNTSFLQGGNSFTAAAVLGTNDVYDLLFETNNVSRGGVDSTGKWMFGLTTPITDTHKSNKSLGNTSAGWAEKWNDSDNALIASLDNNGMFAAYGGLSTDGVASIFSNTTDNKYFIGGSAGNGSTGMNNVFVGNQAGANSTDDYLIAFGTNALFSSVGANKNSFGINSGYDSNGTNCNFFGTNTGYEFVGDYADFFGFAAGQSGSGNRKIGFGIYAGRLNTDSNVAIFADYYDIYFNYDIARDALGTSTHAVTLQTGGSKAGTNESAAASIFKIAPARGTGNAASGNVVIQRANVQASGTTRHTLSDGLIYEAQTGYTTASTSTSENVLLVGAYQSKSANYTALPTDKTIECTANAFTVTLYTAVGYKARKLIVDNSEGTGTVTIDADGTELVGGALTLTVNVGDSFILQSNGTNWKIIATY